MSRLLSISQESSAVEQASDVLSVTSALISGFVLLLAVAIAF